MEAGTRTGTSHGRIAAAFAFAGLTREQAGAALGVSVETISRLTSGKHNKPELFYGAIAAATNVPPWFLEHGFDGYRIADEEPTLRDEVEAVRHELATVRAQQRDVRELRERLDRLEPRLEAALKLAALWPTLPPPGVQPLGPPESPRSEPSREQSERRRGQGGPPGTEQ